VKVNFTIEEDEIRGAEGASLFLVKI